MKHTHTARSYLWIEILPSLRRSAMHVICRYDTQVDFHMRSEFDIITKMKAHVTRCHEVSQVHLPLNDVREEEQRHGDRVAEHELIDGVVGWHHNIWSCANGESVYMLAAIWKGRKRQTYSGSDQH